MASNYQNFPNMKPTVTQAQPHNRSEESRFVEHQMSTSLLSHIRGSHFLELLTLSFFLGADAFLQRQCSLPRQHSNMLKEVLEILGSHESSANQRLDDTMRLVEKHKLLEHVFKAGQQCAACWQARETRNQISLQQLVAQFAHYSMLDLSKHGFTQQHLEKMRHVEEVAKAPATLWERILSHPVLLSVFWFLLLSLGGSVLALWLVYPEVLQTLYAKFTATLALMKPFDS